MENKVLMMVDEMRIGIEKVVVEKLMKIMNEIRK